LLARFLARAPDRALLQFAAGLVGDETELGRAMRVLARTAAAMLPETADREYHDLFVGVGRGELVPFGSHYLTGFLEEEPLDKLRGDMDEFGIRRRTGGDAPDDHPEDHIAALCEVMAGLITGDLGSGHSLANQRSFFEAHLAPWAGRFFHDLEMARSSVIYTPIGTMGRIFMEIESVAFEMDGQ
jgi:TorA maturation chaperone TorD